MATTRTLRVAKRHRDAPIDYHALTHRQLRGLPPLNQFYAANDLPTTLSAWESWVDEIAIGPSPIGCSN
jgi:hypothetical protein